VGSEHSAAADVLSGIPQGSILWPILFTIFINDIADNLKSGCKIFADDTKIYNSTLNSDDIQSDVETLQQWTEQWDLHFNKTKCHVLHMGKNNPACKYTFKEGNEEVQIKTCEEERDLSVVFDGKLSFDTHIQSCIKKANSVLGIIRRSFTYLDKDTFLRLYKSMVRPHLEYANVIGSPHLN
jgi:S-adenosylmethionine:tRNA-ribosyltransferase-isomerase (queuine synthetase)